MLLGWFHQFLLFPTPFFVPLRPGGFFTAETRTGTPRATTSTACFFYYYSIFPGARPLRRALWTALRSLSRPKSDGCLGMIFRVIRPEWGDGGAIAPLEHHGVQDSRNVQLCFLFFFSVRDLLCFWAGRKPLYQRATTFRVIPPGKRSHDFSFTGSEIF